MTKIDSLTSPGLEFVRSRWDDLFRDASAPLKVRLFEKHWINIAIKSYALKSYGRVLDIGCGIGADAQYFVPHSESVTALDISFVALKALAKHLPTVRLINAILPHPLPFRTAVFNTVVAGLSLHYFPWRETEFVIGEIHRVLQKGGILILRVNSTSNSYYGYRQGPEVEQRCFFYKDQYKRFFTEGDIKKLFNAGWEIVDIGPHIDRRYDNPRHTLFAVCRKLAI
jgi:ubiquinone/menaquinone biosynthesis C-methylase UbiE